MTSAALLRAFVVWWWVVLLGLAVTVMAVVGVQRIDGVYWARAAIVLLPPSGPAPGNVLEGYSASLINFAGAVERHVNEGARTPRLSSSSATLYGTGVRDGVSVTLSDEGGQWESEFKHATLVIEVVGPTAQEVEEKFDATVKLVEKSVYDLQVGVGVTDGRFITTIVSPGHPAATYIATSDGRAVLVLCMLGAAGTAVVVALAERRRRRSLEDVARRAVSGAA